MQNCCLGMSLCMWALLDQILHQEARVVREWDLYMCQPDIVQGCTEQRRQHAVQPRIVCLSLKLLWLLDDPYPQYFIRGDTRHS